MEAVNLRKCRWTSTGLHGVRSQKIRRFLKADNHSEASHLPFSVSSSRVYDPFQPEQAYRRYFSKKFWVELIAYFPLIRRVQQFCYCCLCIRCSGNVFKEPLPSGDREIKVQTQRLMVGIYEVRCWDGFRCHDIIKIGSGIQQLMEMGEGLTDT
jgi:hypothetical protein